MEGMMWAKVRPQNGSYDVGVICWIFCRHEQEDELGSLHCNIGMQCVRCTAALKNNMESSLHHMVDK
eukprot:930381-Pelagomonas_calceolata.AAC.2